MRNMTNMKRTIFLLIAILVLVGAGVSPASAGIRGDIWIGPIWGPWWGPSVNPYPYYASPPVVLQQQPPTYEEQAPQQEVQQSYWYFCASSKTYYPYVKECPGGWLKVVPTPTPPASR
jgi:hypothetical protein